MERNSIKSELRKTKLALRDNIDPELRLEYSLRIADHAFEGLAVEPGAVFSGFFPIRSEADIRPLMAGLKAAGARICLPVVIDRETIVFRELVVGAALVDTGFGTRGPGPEAEVLDPDVLLVPLSVFDGRGNRIGYGAGHYDRAIARLRQKGRSPRLIGIAFDCQEVAEVPLEPHDVPLDAIITESGYRRFVD
ncbi:5-formyltetrahydrofolate cyclo-ligase [Peteryoungia desertarenae]|uniref:5-formyltetrahydrofolate cyclo-ligase n=1 Tax=Peteryoungia desertarenae TaxID=1813451 RepID=A0ABX6QRW8_9HYPH|nr:5-formyltetrahydrofolate cyclo-ligase [Peteryoungia desertarenae]QLF71187.1 5-formyltetrahydrofolate cyclo-ligase [Peteryoungia desertarenae]